MQMKVKWKGKVDRKDIDEAFRTIVLGIYRDVIIGTPVDTGRARGNWQLAIGAPPAGESSTLDKGSVNNMSSQAGQSVTKADKILSMRSVGRSAFVANNLPYIGRLEEGHSSQAKGFVETAMKRAEAFLLHFD